jgi:LemA protein
MKGVYGGLILADQNVKASWAGVEAQLQRCYDLLPNLVRTAQGYAFSEREILQAVTDARARVGQARSIEEKISANNELGASASKLLLAIDQSPDLASNVTFVRIRDELGRAEETIAVETERYNALTQTYNLEVDGFPSSLLARLFGFERAPSFEAVEIPGATPVTASPRGIDS